MEKENLTLIDIPPNILGLEPFDFLVAMFIASPFLILGLLSTPHGALGTP